MPWRESTIMEERFRFVTRRLEGESMTALCEEFGISRKTGHKIFARYKEHGLEALRDRPRTPRRNANRVSMPVEALIVRLKREKPHWGARKLRELLAKRLGGGVPVPARSTIHAVLDRHGLVEHARARRPRATGTPLGEAAAPNDIWGTDFKGEFRLGDRRWCFPLTATDRLSRFLLLCEALEGTAEAPVFTAFHRLFEERGLPLAIRSDNGGPFAGRGLYGLSALSVWWLRLGIRLERIKPGCPQQNGQHERMHLTLKEETTRPAAENALQQQARFDAFRGVQHRASARSLGHEDPGRGLHRVAAALRRPAGARISVARPRHRRHVLRRHLPLRQAGFPLVGPRWPAPRAQGGRARRLARQLHALRSRLHRPGGANPADHRQPVRRARVAVLRPGMLHPRLSYRFANLESSRDAPTGASPAKNRARTCAHNLPPKGGARQRRAEQPSAPRSARGCHPCARYKLLPMCPGWTQRVNEAFQLH
jgi:transposase